MRFEVLQLAQPFDSQAAPDCALRSRRLGSGRLGDSTIAGAKAGRRAARAKNRLFWPVGDKTGDSSHKPDRKADITRDSSAFSREAGPKTASQPPQPADNRAFLPRLDKTCVYSRTLRPEEAFPQRIKTQYGDKLPPAEEAIHYSLLNGRQPLASSASSGCGASGTLRGRSAMCPDSPKRPLRGALKPIRVLQADALGDALGT